jgi:hypothetical protein
MNPGVADSVMAVGWSKDLRVMAPTATLAFVHYMGSMTSPEEADAFVDQLKTGENLTVGMPVFALRRLLINAMRALRKPPRDHTCAVIAKAWLAFEQGRKLRVLKWLASEEFPRFATSWPEEDEVAD